ncbi:hypothetical protein MSSD14B_41220 [Marinobacter salsuginis]|jgi:hypothetical protein|uniref:Uncharacterized protein n=1 Tax=Marinobacter salsuginis TaxID=418719 RepID=A0A5M3Q627_9GAMM|nr:hypothetical protein MSSD14B_41220 [Marinobacter salsuginis]
MLFNIVFLVITMPIGAMVHPWGIVVPPVLLTLWGLWQMNSGARNLKRYRNGEILIDPRTGNPYLNPDHPRNQRSAPKKSSSAFVGAAAGTTAAATAWPDDPSGPVSTAENFVDDSLSEPSINPATGLAMVGGIDTDGNLYGCSGASDDMHSIDSGIGDDLGTGIDDGIGSSFDDDFGCGIDDSFGGMDDF